MAKVEGISDGGDSVAAEQLEAVKKYKATKYMGYVIVSAATAAVSWFVLPETLKPPLRFLCAVVIPELWVICGDVRLMFLLSNIIIVILAIKSGMFSGARNGCSDFYTGFVKKSAESRPKNHILDSSSQSSDCRSKPLRAAAGKCDRSRSEIMIFFQPCFEHQESEAEKTIA